ncbi:hypothetical protein [Burkholderia sp. TSV86]|uniref:hypothetical protein n=1 Tax=Burkholderia sp. TSV86 TaxID=1385594 RepID=UPI0012E3AB03|nr:hypothetical protein [Burkholderia sp. TSV86]
MPSRMTRRRSRAARFAPGGAFAFGACAPDRFPAAARFGCRCADTGAVRVLLNVVALELVAAARDATLIPG